MRTQQNTSVDFKGREFHQLFATLALVLTALTLWALTHEYRGLVLDGQIYAVQALAKLRPSLNSDLFLQNTTQDRFTIFPLAYAWVISLIGLNPAAVLLTTLFSVWFLYAAWNLTKYLFDRECAWLAVFLLVISGGHYGAAGVFRFMEPFLTARLPTEALVVTALVLYVRRFEKAALLLTALALFVHPLMALPGLLLLICMRLPLRISAIGAGIGAFGCLGIAFAAAQVPAVEHFLPLMDPSWQEVVRERSQFLFLHLWAFRDWELVIRPFVCLTLTWMTLHDPRVRQLTVCAMLVGATGLLIAGVASAGGPALLVQGQAWRWTWITTFVSLVLLVPTARHLWSEDDTWGPVCAVSLVAGWSFSADIGFVFASLALLIGILRGHLRSQPGRVNPWIIAAICVSVLPWIVADTQTAIASLPPFKGNFAFVVSSMRAILGLKIGCVVLASAMWYWIGKNGSRTRQIVAACALAALSVTLLHDTFMRSTFYGSVSDVTEFADWRERIPPGSTVFVTNGHDSGSFVWFTLERNNYLSPGQSAGVVFSRATALEVKRRSDVLLPLVDPTWKILTSLRRAASNAPGGGVPPNHRPLTAKSLVSVCSDRALGFVVAPENVGFDPVQHRPAGAYKNWNLYDCNHVRALSTAL